MSTAVVKFALDFIEAGLKNKSKVIFPTSSYLWARLVEFQVTNNAFPRLKNVFFTPL